MDDGGAPCLTLAESAEGSESFRFVVSTAPGTDVENSGILERMNAFSRSSTSCTTSLGRFQEVHFTAEEHQAAS